MRLFFGLVLAMASAAVLSWSFVAQHRESNRLARLSLKHPLSSLLRLFRSGPWLLAWVIGLGGWGLYIGALALAPISLVQAISAGGVGLVALLAWRVSRQPMSRRDHVAVGLSLTGLSFVLVSFAGGVPSPRAPGADGVLVWVGATACAAMVSATFGARLLRPGAGLGAAAGLLYAAGDVSTKGAVEIGFLFIPLLLAGHFFGFATLQLSFQRGSPLATAGMTSLLNNALPIIAGVVAFHERLPNGGFGVVRAIGFVVVVVGAALLARPDSARTLAGHHRSREGNTRRDLQPTVTRNDDRHLGEVSTSGAQKTPSEARRARA